MPREFASGAVRRASVLALFLVVTMPDAWAQSAIEISDAWARETVPGQRVAGVYLHIRSAAQARLIRVTSPAAKAAEIHSMKEAGGVMRMRRLDGLELPAGQIVKLEPGGNHIMLLEIGRQLKPGEHVRLTLVVEQKGKTRSVPVVVEVRQMGSDK